MRVLVFDNHVSIGHFVSFQHFQDWCAVVGSSGWSLGLIVCPVRLNSDPVLSASAGSWALTWGLQDGIQSCAVAFYLVLWQAVLCLFTYLDLVCLLLHLRLWLSSSRGSAFGALSLCSRLCARVRPHLFVCSPIGFSGVPLGVAESEQLLGNTWSPLFQAFVRRLYSLGLYRSDVCAWLALFC